MRDFLGQDPRAHRRYILHRSRPQPFGCACHRERTKNAWNPRTCSKRSCLFLLRSGWRKRIMTTVISLYYFSHSPRSSIRRSNSPSTEHVVFSHARLGDAERDVRIPVVLVDGELPKVDAAREPERAEDDAVIEAGTVGAHQVGPDLHVRVCGRRIQGERRHCNKRSIRFEPSLDFTLHC